MAHPWLSWGRASRHARRPFPANSDPAAAERRGRACSSGGPPALGRACVFLLGEPAAGVVRVIGGRGVRGTGFESPGRRRRPGRHGHGGGPGSGVAGRPGSQNRVERTAVEEVRRAVRLSPSGDNDSRRKLRNQFFRLAGQDHFEFGEQPPDESSQRPMLPKDWPVVSNPNSAESPPTLATGAVTCFTSAGVSAPDHGYFGSEIRVLAGRRNGGRSGPRFRPQARMFTCGDGCRLIPSPPKRTSMAI